MERNIRRIRLFLHSKPTGGGSSKYTESILDTPLSRVLNSLKTFVVYTFPEWDQLLAGNPLLKLRNQLEFSKPFSILLFADPLGASIWHWYFRSLQPVVFLANARTACFSEKRAVRQEIVSYVGANRPSRILHSQWISSDRDSAGKTHPNCS